MERESNLAQMESWGFKTWRTQQGDLLKPSEMSDSHLANTVAFIKRRIEANKCNAGTASQFPTTARLSCIIAPWEYDNGNDSYDPFDPFMTETSADEYYWNIKENNHDR